MSTKDRHGEKTKGNQMDNKKRKARKRIDFKVDRKAERQTQKADSLQTAAENVPICFFPGDTNLMYFGALVKSEQHCHYPEKSQLIHKTV